MVERLLGLTSRPVAIDAAVVLDSDGVVARDASVILSGDRIEAVRARTAEDAPAGFGSATSVVVPGFVNAHQHGRPVDTAHLGIPDAPLEIWLAWLATLPGSSPGPTTLAAARRLANGGATTTLHFHATGATTADELDEELRLVAAQYNRVGIRSVIACDLRDRGSPVYGDTDGFLAKLRDRDASGSAMPSDQDPIPFEAVIEVIEGLNHAARLGALDLAAVAYGPAGPPWCSDDLLRAVARSSHEHSIPIQTHLNESRTERAHGFLEYGESAVVHLDRIGFLGSLTSLAHCVWMDDDEISCVAASESAIVTNPSSNLRLHAGIAPVSRFLDAGIAVGIGTDNNRLTDDEDMLAEARLLRALHRAPGVTDRGIDATRLMSMLTREATASMGLRPSGLVRSGQLADLVVLRPPAHALTDLSSTLELLFEVSDRSTIEAVFCNGAKVELQEPELEDIADLSHRDPAARERVQYLIPHLEEHYEAIRIAAEEADHTSLRSG